jgi:hypothetical protein
MPFKFELHADRPVLMVTSELHANSDEIPALEDEAIDWLNRLDHRVFYIINLGDVKLSLGDLMESAQHAARGSTASLHHPNVIEPIVVTTDQMIVMAARSVNSYIFGRLKLKVVPTLNEALAYVDEKVADAAG